MGLVFVLLFWGIVGLILGGAGALAARMTATLLTRGNYEGPEISARKRAIRIATLLPFACLSWVGAIFILQGYINTTILHRDMGIGDSSYCPLPNGYSVLMIDVSDQGTVYNPRTQLGDGTVVEQEDAISGVRELQVADARLLGGADSRYSEHFGQSSPSIDRYFVLDTRTGKRTDFTTDTALRSAASMLGIELKLKPIFEVYRQYRFTWFDLAAALFMFLPPVLAAAGFLRSIVRLRHTRAHMRSA
jgi:hypothetical protein